MSYYRSFPINTYLYSSSFLTFILLFLLLSLLIAPKMCAAEIQSEYATIQYGAEKDLQEFNDQLYLPRQLSYKLREREISTVHDEIGAKIDIVIDKVQNVLQMFIPGVKFEIKVFPSAKDAQEALYEKYGRKVNFISFYSRRDNILYLSAEDATLSVVAHELGHVVVEHYFNRSPPVRMHEVMAQYAESHITE